ncbi:hypothetical protein [Nesterenkonia xinjiangensis]|uniref:Uncharacterized protein n=1 Tax=Nesterenkonia xinjiangensis TaxID=225327 RepID=A0A7Z0GPS2_9MICC|nr:hypothetical protein [Nesterenkonia xinjiangensis]NYJ79051.1 hypothetical protein [Nesterenkonia xinjiangensis]
MSLPGDAESDSRFAGLRVHRVRVHGPRTAPEADEVLLAPARGHVRRRVSSALVSRLIRDQLRLAVGWGLGFFLLLVALYLVLSTLDVLAAVTVLGVPLPWLVPALCFYPLLMLGGWLHLRGSEAAERRLLTEVGLVGEPHGEYEVRPADGESRA